MKENEEEDVLFFSASRFKVVLRVGQRLALEAGSLPEVCVSPKYFRPTEVETLLGDPAKAKKHLG